MADRLSRPCLSPSCPLLAQPGRSYCRAHLRALDRQRQAHRRSAPGDGAARQARRALNRAGAAPCAACHEVFPAAVLEVDHIRPLRAGGHDTMANLQVLCHRCHVLKTTGEGRV